MLEQPNQFRSAFNGFNRDDVVRYMEFINNKHSAQVAQLTNELEYLKGKQDTLDAGRVSELEKQLNAALAENDALKHRIAILEHSLQEAKEAAAQPAAPVQSAPPSASELEAYRRAERVERVAKERARQVGQQTAQTLGAISTQMDDAAQELSQMAAQIARQLEQLQQAVAGRRQAVGDAAGMVAALNAEIDE